MLRKLATLGGVGLAGIALIGAGAAATFTQDTSSYHAVQAGTMNVVLSTGNGPQSQTLSFPAGAAKQSTFSISNDVDVNNIGNITANEVRLQLTDNASVGTADQALKSQLSVCMQSMGYVIFNGKLTDFENYGSIVIGPQSVPPPDAYTITLYAGSGFQGCGAAASGITAGSPSAYTTALTATGTNTAASLTNTAQGGSLAVIVTLSYEG